MTDHIAGAGVAAGHDDAPQQPHRRAVLADDDADLLGLLVIAARKADLEIVAAVDNGDAAWAAISCGGIDIAILDISMPGLTGVQVAERVRSDPSLAAMRIIIVSASVYMLERQADLLVDADTFIRKPFSPKALTGIIRTTLGDMPR
jgi:two-component system OmpR family response regulator